MTARVTLTSDQLHCASGFTPTPGMPAEIMIQPQERIFAQYITKPIADSMSRAFREHDRAQAAQVIVSL